MSSYSGRKPFFADRHLDSPVLDMNLRRLSLLRRVNLQTEKCRNLILPVKDIKGQDHSHTSEREYRQIIRVLEVTSKERAMDLHQVVTTLPQDYYKLFQAVDFPRPLVDSVLDHSTEAARLILVPLAMSLGALTGVNPEQVSHTLINQTVRDYYAREEIYASHIESYITFKAAGGEDPFLSRTRSSSAVIAKALVIIWANISDPTYWAMTYEQLLMIRDVLMMRRNAHLTASVIYPEDHLLPTLMEASFLWQEKCLTELGNQGYEMAKSTEALSKTYLSRLAGDPLPWETDSFSEMLKKVTRKEEGFLKKVNAPYPNRPTLAQIYYETVLSKTEEIYQGVELFGLQKFCGHPLIDPYLGGALSAEKAREPDQTTLESALRLRRQFCRLFSEAYIKKRHSWPPLIFLKKGTYLEHLYNSSALSLSRHSYNHEDWDWVDFKKEFELEEFSNYLELLDDKAISFYNDEKHLAWDRGQPTSERRLLMEILQRPSFNLSQIIQIVETNQIPDRWKICSLYPKEREFKLAARMFVMLCLEMRTFFAAHEANLAISILPFFPQITMTDDKTSVHKRFLDMTRPLTSPDIIRVYVELDLSSWNLAWRALCVEMIGRDLNNLFGRENIFTTVHKFFSECRVHVRVQGCRPNGIEQLDPPESLLAWRNHIGGFEGIAQKLWSIATVCMIEVALTDVDLHYTMTEQGDNVVLTLTAPRDHSLSVGDQMKVISDDILSKCQKASADVHQEMKTEECLVSSTVITYSKNVYVNGVDYPLTLKSMSRVHPSSALDFPSYGAYLQAIFSGAYTAGEASKRPIRCYWLAIILGSIFITRTSQQGGAYHKALKNVHSLRTPRGIALQLLWPSELGGLPIIGPYAFLYKGGGDPLSKSLASLKLIQTWSPEAREIIGLSFHNDLYTIDPKAESLLQDPYGLPVTKPVSPSDSIARGTLEVIKQTVKNREIRQVLSFASDIYKDDLIKTVMTLKPFNPVIARDLLDASSLGSVDTISRMFLNTRTIQTISRRGEGVDLIGTLLRAGSTQIFFMARLVERSRGEAGTIDSLFLYVEQLRGRWKPIGAIPEGLTSYLPIDFRLCWDNTCKEVGIVAELRTLGQDIFYDRGPHSAYLGTRTIEKRADHGYRIIGRGYATSALRTLQSILSWSRHGPDMCLLIDHLSRSRSGVDLSQYSSILASVLGGDTGHRYAARIGERDAGIMGFTSPSTYIRLDSDRAGFLSGSTEDYPVMFQEYFLYMTALQAYRHETNDLEEWMTLTLVIGDSPLQVLPPGRLTVESPVVLREIPGQMSLVQDYGIRMEKRSGPVWDSQLKLHRTGKNTEHFSAIVSELGRALGAQRHLIGVLDHTITRISLRFGLQELEGMGLRMYFDAAACVLLDSISGVIHSPTLGPRFNASVNYVTQRYGNLLVSAVLPLLSHPVMLEDPLVQLLNLGPTLTYDHRYSPKRVMIGYLASRASTLFQDSRSIYYASKIIIYASQSGSATLDALIRVLRRRVSLAMITGLISEDDANFVVGSSIRRLQGRGFSAEPDKINEFLRLLKTYDEHRRGGTLISRACADIAARVALSLEDHRVYTSEQAAEEIIRDFRYHPAVRLAARPEIRVLPMDVPGVNLSNFTEPPISIPLTAHHRLEFSLQSSLSRAVSLGSGAVRTWLQLSGLFSGEEVLIVGSGLGACALAALRGGSIRVHGHDLRSDFPPDISLSAYRPPLLRLYREKGHYTQTEATLASSGDWFDISVARRLLNLTSRRYIVVLDISSERGFSEKVLRPLYSLKFPYRVVCRIQNNLATHGKVCGMIKSTGRMLAAYQFNQTGPIYERVYVFLLDRWREPLVYQPAYPIKYEVTIPKREKPTLWLLASYVLSPLGGCMDGTLEQALCGGLRMFEGMLGKSISQPSYEEWTATLHSALACQTLLWATPESFVTYVLWMESQLAVPILLEKTILVTVTTPLVMFMSRTVSRLVGHLDKVVAMV